MGLTQVHVKVIVVFINYDREAHMHRYCDHCINNLFRRKKASVTNITLFFSSYLNLVYFNRRRQPTMILDPTLTQATPC